MAARAEILPDCPAEIILSIIMLSKFLFIAFILIMANSVFAQMPPLETGVSQTLAKWRAAHYSGVRYKLNLTLERQAPLMKGEMELRVNLTGEGAKNDLILDWRTTQFADDKEKPYAKVIAVNNAFDVLSTVSKEHLIVSKDALKAGENVIRLQFASPIKTSGAAITRYIDKEDGVEYVYSLFVPSDASTAFPVFDQPDLKAQFTLNVTMPKRWRIVSNTELKQRLISDVRCPPQNPSCEMPDVWQFKETKPISTYVFAFAAGEFTQFQEASTGKDDKGERSYLVVRDYAPENLGTDKASSIYVRKSQAEKFKAHAAETFRLNREAVKYLEGYFDFKFPFPKYDLVLIPEFPFNGMEHAGATFLREASVIFPSEPTKNDYVARANVIFHEAAHQWFGDTVTMKWFDDLWLKEGFAEFMAYKTLEKTMPAYNAWKAFYERNKPLAYLTDATRGTTPIYQEIANLSAAKSAYGNIVYRKAPSFLRQAEFYLGEEEFQTAVRAFLKKYQYKNAEWTDLVKEFEAASKQSNKKYLEEWAEIWVKRRGVFKIVTSFISNTSMDSKGNKTKFNYMIEPWYKSDFPESKDSIMYFDVLVVYEDGTRKKESLELLPKRVSNLPSPFVEKKPVAIIPNYQDYGYGIFLLDPKSRDYVLKNIQNEKDDFLRSMMWGTLWDSVREAELNPRDYVELAIKNISVETDEVTIQTILSRVSTAMNYYLPDQQRDELAPRLEAMLLQHLQQAPNNGLAVTFYRAFVNLSATARAREELKNLLANGSLQPRKNRTDKYTGVFLRTKDKFDIIAKLAVLGDPDAPKLLADLQQTEASDDAKRYAYAVGAGFAAKEAKEKYFNDFLNNKEISESWIEAAFVPFNAVRHSELTAPYLEKALAELPNLKRRRKIFFVNGWLGAFIGGQKDEKALAAVNKFLADNPNLDKDLRLKILENLDGLERAVKIRNKW